MTSTTASSSVSSARKASTPVIGLPTPVAGGWRRRFRRSVGASSGSDSTHSTSTMGSRPPTAAARKRRARHRCDSARVPLRCRAPDRAEQQRAGETAADRRFGQRHVDAANRRTHTSDSSSP